MLTHLRGVYCRLADKPVIFLCPRLFGGGQQESIDICASKERVLAFYAALLTSRSSVRESPFVRNSHLLMLTGAAMAAFAGNSVICRLALRQTLIDPVTFTIIRLVSGAAALLTLVYLRSAIHNLRAARQADSVSRALANRLQLHLGGSWIAAAVLVLYAVTFSYAYVQLPAGAGALLLFGAVQLTMVLYGWYSSECMTVRRVIGFLLATFGLLATMAPGLTAPPLGGALLMLSSGVAWAAYSLRGRGSADPIGDTAGNFGRAAPRRCKSRCVWQRSAGSISTARAPSMPPSPVS